MPSWDGHPISEQDRNSKARNTVEHRRTRQGGRGGGATALPNSGKTVGEIWTKQEEKNYVYNFGQINPSADFLFIVPVHCKKEICALRSIPYGPQVHPVHEKKVIVSKSHNNGPYQLALCGRFVFGRRSTEKKRKKKRCGRSVTNRYRHDTSGSLREDTCTGCRALYRKWSPRYVKM